jgi:hypothetical protein
MSKINDLEKINVHLRHIKMVESNMQKLAKKMLPIDREFALKLIQNSRQHDLSKFDEFEFDHLIREEGNDDFDVALAHHQNNNPHHPEYWNGIHHMPDEYIAEMVCDCLARSQEFGTDIKTWFSRIATKRYGYTVKDPVYQRIKYYLGFLLLEKFKR